VVVVQSDSYNRTGPGTVVVAVITSTTQVASRPGNVFLPAAASGLPRDSVVNVTALVTVDRRELESRVGSVPQSIMRKVDQGLRRVFEL
jgi:mRNA interferase MazF